MWQGVVEGGEMEVELVSRSGLGQTYKISKLSADRLSAGAAWPCNLQVKIMGQVLTQPVSAPGGN